MKKIILLFTLLPSFLHVSFAQDPNLVDSLQTQLKKHNAHKLELGKNARAMDDSTAVNILTALSQSYWGNNPVKAMDYAEQALALSQQIGYNKGVGAAFNSMGVINHIKGDYLQAFDFFKKALLINQEIGNKKSISNNYMNIGNTYMYLGNYPEALKNFFTAFKIKEEIGDKQGIAGSYANIGIIYKHQANYPEALKNFNASLNIFREIGDKQSIASAYNNIGVIYQSQFNYTEAMKNFLASVKIREETGDKHSIATSYNNIGEVYQSQGNYAEALKNHLASLKLKKEIGDKNGIANSYNNIGEIYSKMKRYNEASDYLNKALSIAKEIGSLDKTKDSYEALATLDSGRGNFNKALEHYKLFVALRDSLVNNENTKKTLQQQMQYDFDKKQVTDSLHFAQEKEVGEIKLQKQKAITYSGFIGIAITILLLFFVYRNYNRQRIANKNLREAQEQLIKSEKMAAFGVMASRVSHEIQNPLNFVNNFSELSQEMLTDVISSTSEEDKKQNTALLYNNLQKIKEQGKRASEIVKQLQEHSRKGSAHEFFEEKQQ